MTLRTKWPYLSKNMSQTVWLINIARRGLKIWNIKIPKFSGGFKPLTHFRTVMFRINWFLTKSISLLIVKNPVFIWNCFFFHSHSPRKFSVSATKRSSFFTSESLTVSVCCLVLEGSESSCMLLPKMTQEGVARVDQNSKVLKQTKEKSWSAGRTFCVGSSLFLTLRSKK